jgi:hypothetical protein
MKSVFLVTGEPELPHLSQGEKEITILVFRYIAISPFGTQLDSVFVVGENITLFVSNIAT